MIRILLIIYMFFISLDIHAIEHLEPEIRNSLPQQVCNYLNNLPKINDSLLAENLNEKATGIVTFLKEFSLQNEPKHKQKIVYGEDVLAQQFLDQLETSLPIRMHIIGFPFKSINKETKVYSPLVDMGEFIGILTLHHICREIGKTHTPGANIVIISDCAAFADFLGESKQEYREYRRSLKQIIEPFKENIIYVSPKHQRFHKYLETIYNFCEANFFEFFYGTADRLTDFLPFTKEELACKRGDEILELNQSKNASIRGKSRTYLPTNR